MKRESKLRSYTCNMQSRTLENPLILNKLFKRNKSATTNVNKILFKDTNNIITNDNDIHISMQGFKKQQKDMRS